jgi:hypothetical protein
MNNKINEIKGEGEIFKMANIFSLFQDVDSQFLLFPLRPSLKIPIMFLCYIVAGPKYRSISIMGMNFLDITILDKTRQDLSIQNLI